MLENFKKFEIQRNKKNTLTGGSSGQPGGSLNVIIRGQSSLSNNTPLYIVDGIQVRNNHIASPSD